MQPAPKPTKNNPLRLDPHPGHRINTTFLDGYPSPMIFHTHAMGNGLVELEICTLDKNEGRHEYVMMLSPGDLEALGKVVMTLINYNKASGFKPA
jgi:hypothetical protein